MIIAELTRFRPSQGGDDHRRPGPTTGRRARGRASALRRQAAGPRPSRPPDLPATRPPASPGPVIIAEFPRLWPLFPGDDHGFGSERAAWESVPQYGPGHPGWRSSAIAPPGDHRRVFPLPAVTGRRRSPNAWPNDGAAGPEVGHWRYGGRPQDHDLPGHPATRPPQPPEGPDQPDQPDRPRPSRPPDRPPTGAR